LSGDGVAIDGGPPLGRGGARDPCQRRSHELLAELGLPNGLLLLQTLEEVGYNRSSGFVCLCQAAGVTHTFQSIGKQVWYDREVTTFMEQGRMHSLTSVKSKELLIWVTIPEIVVSPSGTKIVFRTPARLGCAFQLTEKGLPTDLI
jgi:hypothetical protein